MVAMPALLMLSQIFTIPHPNLRLTKVAVGWVERLFAIPIIGVKALDGYRKKPLHPSYEFYFRARASPKEIFSTLE
jgi:hypothetical protein